VISRLKRKSPARGKREVEGWWFYGFGLLVLVCWFWFVGFGLLVLVYGFGFMVWFFGFGFGGFG